MKIGIAGPVSLKLLSHHIPVGVRDALPEGYKAPQIAGLVEELLRRGHHVSVFTVDSTTSRLTAFRGNNLTIHIGHLRARAREKALDLFSKERSDLISAMKSDPCDIIHAQWTYEFALAALESGFPTLVTARDAPWRILRFMPNAYRFIRLLMAVEVSLRCLHMTAVSPYIAEHFRKYMLYSKPITVVPNGLSDSIFSLISAKKGENEVVSFGTNLNGWGRLKNGQSVLEAFRLMHRSEPKTRLLMFGSEYGPTEEASIWARQRGLSEGVEFIGALSYEELLKRLVFEVDILVHPSLEESFSMAIAEALALGIPVIGGRYSGAVPSTLNKGKAGLLVDMRSPDELSRAMLQLARDASLRRKLVQQGKEFAQTQFNIKRVVNSYEDLYHRVMTSS